MHQIADARGSLAARGLQWLDRLLCWTALVIGGSTLAFTTVLSVVNVLVMRKALNAPIRGAEDLMVLSLVLVVAVAIPFGARTGAHIEIELLENALPRRFGQGSLVLMKAVAAAAMAVLAWRLWEAGGQAARFGESSQTLIISFGPFYRILAVSTSIYGVVLVLELLLLLRDRHVTRINIYTGEAS